MKNKALWIILGIVAMSLTVALYVGNQNIYTCLPLPLVLIAFWFFRKDK